MDAILRAATVYLALLLIFRVLGKRTLAQITTFDLVLLLVVSEATQQALLGEDFSITMAVLVILTLVGLDRLADYIGWRFPRAGRLLNGSPVVLIERGRAMQDRLLERSGRISIIPKS